MLGSCSVVSFGIEVLNIRALLPDNQLISERLTVLEGFIGISIETLKFVYRY